MPISLIDTRAVTAPQFIARAKSRGATVIDLRSRPATGEWHSTYLRRRLGADFIEFPYLQVADVTTTDTGPKAVLRQARLGAQCLEIFAEQKAVALLYDAQTIIHREALSRVFRRYNMPTEPFRAA